MNTQLTVADFARAQEHARAVDASRQSANDTTPTILIGVDESRVTDEALDALSKRATNVFQRAGLLVHITHESHRKAKIARALGAPRCAPLPSDRLREEMARVAVWRAPTREGTKPSHPPQWCVAQVMARPEWPMIPPLEGIVETPVLRVDGTVVTTPGYDEATGLFFAPTCTVPTIPANPTREDAVAATAKLLEVVEDFPFAKPEHQSAFLAALLTPFVRFAYHGPAPLFLIDANTRGAGKSLLTDVLAGIISGRDMPRMPPADDPEEERKRITSVAMDGTPNILFDNVLRLGSPALDAALTATEWTDRVLGSNRKISIPVQITWFATGNNVQVRADTARRCLHIRLETDLENPERRSKFKHPDLLGYVREHRGELVAACLTVLRAYFEAGKPVQKDPDQKDLAPWGSFEAWSRIVRHAIVWLGLPDPGLTRDELAENDTDSNALADLLSGWLELQNDHNGEALSTADAAKALENNPHKYDRLRTAIGEVARIGPKGPSARDVGFALRPFKGRVCNGRRFENRKSNGARTWCVVKLGKKVPHGHMCRDDRDDRDNASPLADQKAIPSFISARGETSTLSTPSSLNLSGPVNTWPESPRARVAELSEAFECEGLSEMEAWDRAVDVVQSSHRGTP